MLAIVAPSDPDYAGRVATLLARTEVTPAEILRRAAEIVADVRARGDAAVADYTRRFDGREPGATGYEVPPARWEALVAGAAPGIAEALGRAAARIATFHERQRETGYTVEEPGIRCTLRIEPLARVGLYVPGGAARSPSSVLMTAVPARIAGVREIVMVTPGASAETLCAARVAGVDRVFEIGGAQAIAALAYGTETVPRVEKIVGPGNAYVAAAKRLVFGDVGIDSIAGPSEVLVIADDSADPVHVAADLLAQAEHDEDACALLVTPSLALAQRVSGEIERQLATLPRRGTASASIARHGAAIVTPDVASAVRLANRFAPEHLELHVREPRRVAEAIRTAGAIFVGPYSPEASGDYLAGPNHVLPTGGSARYASPLGLWDYVKRTSLIEYTREALAGHEEDLELLAGVEGLDAHARSVSVRTGS